jgi:hypothetical protein
MQTSSVARLTPLISCWMLACVAPTSPTTTDTTAVPPVFTERDAAVEPDCPSVVDIPQSLFAGRLELRLPVGVAELVENERGFLVAHNQTAPCVGGRTIASVIVIEQLDDNPNLPIGYVRDDLLDILALPGGMTIKTSEEDDVVRRMTSVISVPAAPEQGRGRPTRLLLALRGGAGRIYVVVFESSPEQFEALLPSFTASLDSVAIRE